MNALLLNVSPTSTYIMAALRGCLVGAVVGLVVALILGALNKSRRGKLVAEYEGKGFGVLCAPKSLGIVLLTSGAGQWLIVRANGKATRVFERGEFRACKVIRPGSAGINILVETDGVADGEVLMKFSTPPLNKRATAVVTGAVEEFVNALQGFVQERG